MDESGPDGYELRFVDHFQEPEHRELVRSLLLEGTSYADWKEILSEEEVDSMERRRAALVWPYVLRMTVHREGSLVGWSHGWQDSPTTFFVANSGVAREHRRKGLYSVMLRHILRRAEADGFAEVHSRHFVTNNPVIIAGLRAGFVIAGIEISATYGALVKLVCPLQSRRREMLDVRSGARRASGSLRAIVSE